MWSSMNKEAWKERGKAVQQFIYSVQYLWKKPLFPQDFLCDIVASHLENTVILAAKILNRGNNSKYISTVYVIPCSFNSVQWLQRVTQWAHLIITCLVPCFEVFIHVRNQSQIFVGVCTYCACHWFVRLNHYTDLKWIGHNMFSMHIIIIISLSIVIKWNT